MKDFDALKDIWHGQVSAPKISDEDILKSIRTSRTGFANKLLIESIGVLTAIVLFIFIWVNTPSMLWTTHLSFIIFLSCCLYYLVVQWGDYKRMANSQFLLKQPEEYMLYLKEYSTKRYRLNTAKYGIYSIFIGVAFALYFVEVYFNSPLWQTIAGVVGIVLWFFVCWYFMKIYISKEQKNLNEMIEKLERLEKQFINEA